MAVPTTGMRMEKMIVGTPNTEAAAGEVRADSIFNFVPPFYNSTGRFYGRADFAVVADRAEDSKAIPWERDLAATCRQVTDGGSQAKGACISRIAASGNSPGQKTEDRKQKTVH